MGGGRVVGEIKLMVFPSSPTVSILTESPIFLLGGSPAPHRVPPRVDAPPL